jgi:sodium/proline symporter
LTGFALFSFLFEDAGMGIGYLGQPHTSVRFMGITDSKALRPAFVLSITFAILVCAGAVMVGLVAHGWYRFAEATPQVSASIASQGATLERIPVSLANQEQEFILPELTLLIMPTWLAGLVVSAIMAAIMSTASGFLLSVTSSLAEDVYHRLVRPNATEKHLVFVSRLVTLGLGMGALVLTLFTDPKDPKSTVYSLVLYGWGGLAGAFSAPVTLALIYPRMTRAGCLAGIIVGGSLVFIWRSIPMLADSMNEIIPSIAASALAIFIFSSFTERPTTEPATEALAHA